MTQKELEQKVIDAESRVAKREAVLKKHNSQLAKMIEKGADRFDVSIKREDIKSATSKLAEARETLANWKDKLNTRITRDAYLEANTPEILKDFLENWKQHAIGYYREKRIRFIEYREDLKAKERATRLEALQTLPSLEKYRELYKGRELTDYDLANLWPRRDVDAFLSERGLEYHQIQKKLREAGDQITLRLLEIRDEDEREAWLEKTMDERKAGQAARPDRPHYEHGRNHHRRGHPLHRPRGRHQRHHRRHGGQGKDPDHRRRRLQHPVLPLQDADPRDKVR